MVEVGLLVEVEVVLELNDGVAKVHVFVTDV